MELPEELLLAISEHLQPARYELEATLPDDYYTAPLPLAVAVWDYETITQLDATAVPLGYV